MNLSDLNIKHLISKKAGELGFIKTGFSKSEILAGESEKLKEWLAKRYGADMEWIARGFEKRKDVSFVMDNAKTIISLAYNYYTPFVHHEKYPKISRYGWGQDYHKVLKNKLKELCKYIKSVSAETNTVFYVDDGPVMEKVWAVRSGIGWMGKHTNVISPEYGSWIFLGEVITDLEIDVYDKPIEDLCGKCTICIDACPTGAIVGEYVLDSRLCISYQNIENRGDIPGHIGLHGWVFGCDTCQDVCPFNKNDKPSGDDCFKPKEKVYNKGKEELENMTEKEFNDIFSDSPVKRTRYEGWKRNLGRIL